MKTPKILPPVYLLLYLLIALALHRWMPIVWVVPQSLRLFGVVPLVAGFLLLSWGATLFKTKGTAIKPFEPSTTLVTQGPYRFTRNPMYLGAITFLTGIAIMLGSLAAFVAPVAMFVTLQRIFIPAEEAMMEQTFGQAYRDFKQRVRRWI